MLDKELCYLSEYGRVMHNLLVARGVDKDLALEVLHLLVPHQDLYELEEVSDEL